MKGWSNLFISEYTENPCCFAMFYIAHHHDTNNLKFILFSYSYMNIYLYQCSISNDVTRTVASLISRAIKTQVSIYLNFLSIYKIDQFYKYTKHATLYEL